MNKHKDMLFHDGTGQFCHYDKAEDKYKFILRVLKNSTDKNYICIDGNEIELDFEYEEGNFKYFSTSVSLKEGVNRYHFMSTGNFGEVFLNAFGESSGLNMDGEFEITPGFFTPDWAKGAVMYQIMVDRFNNGDETNDVYSNEYAYIGRGVTRIYDWNQLPAADDTREFYGGDLQGVIDKLEYLYKLGVQVIYFNPIFVSPSNHKYDTQDYDYVDPHFGKIVNDGGDLLHGEDNNNEHAYRYKQRTTDLVNLEASNQLFIELVEKAHSFGIKIILDGVFNHCGSFNKWMDKERLYKGNVNYAPGAYETKDSPYNTYFKFLGENWPDNYNYEGWWGFDTLPKLNYEDSPLLQEYVLQVGRKWVSPPYNVDGWRLDVGADLGHSPEFNHKFWGKFREAVKGANPNAIILAEHYGDAHEWLKGDQWDTIMNYDAFMDPVTWFLTGVDKHSDKSIPSMRGDAAQFNRAMNYNMSRMQSQSQLVAMNELSNHDHSRFMTRTNKMVGRIATAGSQAASINIDKAIFKQGVVMQMTLPGAPTIYYGDEAGVCGWTDPDNRRTYPWGKEDLEIMEFYREAIAVHKQNSALVTGSYMPLVEELDLLAYGRFDKKQSVITIINTSDDDKEIEIPSWQLGTTDENEYVKLLETDREFFNCSRVKYQQVEGNLKLKVKANSSLILKATK